MAATQILGVKTMPCCFGAGQKFIPGSYAPGFINIPAAFSYLKTNLLITSTKMPTRFAQGDKTTINLAEYCP
jgi:hypothetical protein